MQTNSGTGVLLMIFHYEHHTTFSKIALRFYLFGSNTVKCDENDQCKTINKQLYLKLFFY